MYALECKAVKTLLISDHLFRSKSTLVRKQYVQLAEQAEKKFKAEVVVFSSMSQAGQRLKDLTGVAGVLYCPIPGIDDIEEDSSDDSDKEEKSEESEEEKTNKISFEDEQLELLINEGMIGYGDGETDGEDDNNH